jgi:ketosteroid isomerase-like protein
LQQKHKLYKLPVHYLLPPLKTALILFIFLPITASLSLAQNNSGDIRSLVQAERDFCNISRTQTTKQAFMAVLADDAILFRPQPVNGKKWTSENADGPGLLTWEPAWAETSQTGDLGYTTGPFEFRANRTDSVAAAYGQYVSIWKKQADQPWKLVMDVGIGHVKPEKEPTLSLPAQEKIKPVKNGIQAQQQLLQADKGISKAYAGIISQQARLYRNGHFPLIGNTSINNYLASLKGSLISETTEAFVSQEADMGYTYGTTTYQDEKEEKQYSNYIRIWKRQADNSWKIVLDIETPRPAPKS